ncbi:MAG: NAD-dependent epimerase/dehydratase family protein [Desulfotomaculaceae bacterium]|nr:NAD-dependent epimerase/dehydratase family protein [Desulfotomaculaceae bacterium]
MLSAPDVLVPLRGKGASIAIGDVTDKPSILRGMKGCDWVINLANLYSFWEPDRQIYTKINVEGTRNVMECALETGVSKVVHVSTVAVFGKPVDIPFTEDSPVGPVRFSEYAETKYLGELAAWELYEKKGLPLVVVYPALVTGSGDPKAFGGYMFDFIKRRLPGIVFNNSILTFVYVRDVAVAILKALEKENNIGEKYIVGKFQHSYKELNRILSEISGTPSPKIRFPNSVTITSAALLTLLANLIKKPPLLQLSVDLTRTNIEGIVCDGSKAERELGITYTPIRQAFEEAIESYQKLSSFVG